MVPGILPMTRNAILASVSAWAILGSAASAQVITDGSVGPAGSLTGPNYDIGQQLGRTNAAGTTVLHSFSQFDLATGTSATFTGSPSLTSIIARITDGAPSSIDGTINSSVSGAALYLLNKNGFLFGPNAVINVSGNLYVSTADRLNFADQSFIEIAAGPDGGALSSAPIASFGFLGGGVGNIVINGSPDYTDFVVANGDVSLIASNISVTERAIMAGRNAPSQLRLAAVGAGVGTVGLRGRAEMAGGALTLTGFTNWGPGSFEEMADLYLSGGAILLQNGSVATNNNASTNPYLFTAASGRTNAIDISGGDLVFRSNPSLPATFGIFRGVRNGVATADPGQITIDLTGDFNMTRAVIDVPSWPGRAADVSIRAANVTLTDQSFINVMAGAYDAGTIRLDLTGDLTLSSTSRLVAHAPVGTAVRDFQNRYDPANPGNAGEIIVNAGGQISLLNGAYMSVGSGMTTGGATSGRAGTISLTAAGLTMTNSDITFDARSGGRSAGALNVTVSGDVRLTGTVPVTNPGYGTTFATLDGRAATGDGGTLNLQAGGDIVLNGASVNVSSLGHGRRGGQVNVTARNLIVQNSGFAFGGLPGGDGGGRGGDMTLTTTGDATWQGAASDSGGVYQAINGFGDTGGNVRFNIGGNLTFRDVEMSVGGVNGLGNALFNVGQDFTGEAASILVAGGNLSVRASRIDLSNGADVSNGLPTAGGGQILLHAPIINIGVAPQAPDSRTSVRSGAGGQIILRAETLNLGSGGAVESYASPQNGSPNGNSSSIALYANNLNIAPGAVISSAAPLGRAGDITLGASILDMAGAIETQGQSGGVIRIGVDDEMQLAGAITTLIDQAPTGTDGDVYIGLTLDEPQLASPVCDADCQSFRPFSTAWTPGTRNGVPRTYEYSAATLSAGNTVGRVVFGFGGGSSPEQLALPAQDDGEDSRASAPTYLSALDAEAPSLCDIETLRGRGGNTLSLALRAPTVSLPGYVRAETYGAAPGADGQLECSAVAQPENSVSGVGGWR